MKLAAITIGKITIFFGKILHRGSSLPGKIALKIDKNLLSKLEYSPLRIAITGSSGKGSTSSLIANVLKDNGKSVSFNDAGSNLAWGITTSFLKNVNLFGKMKTEYLVIETDERYVKEVASFVKPTHILITNLTKDQPPRGHHIDIVYNDILKGINPEATIVTNMDEPYLRNLDKDTNNQKVYFSLAKNKYSYTTQIFENLNTYYCPYCKTLLDYDYYNFETLGKYNCHSCSFSYEEPKVVGEKLDLQKEQITINNKVVQIGGDKLYNAYNTIAAYTALLELGLDEDSIANSINKLNKYQEAGFLRNDKRFILLPGKCENAATFNQSVFKTLDNAKAKDIIIGWGYISLRYPHHDISWLYDIEFELLNNKSLNKIYACGPYSKDIKKRLILAGIPAEKIVTADSIPDIKDNVLNSEAKYIYGIINYDYLEAFETTFKEEL